MGLKFTSNTFSSLRAISGVALTSCAVLFPLLYKPHEEATFKAYRDALNRPTICVSHYQGVTLADSATPEQCMEYLRRDAIEAAVAVSAATPTLLENKSAYRAASDFVLIDGIDAYTTSPMALRFQKRDWVVGCNNFVGYHEWFHFKYPSAGNRCIPQANRHFICHVKKLAERRKLQKQLCLGQIK